VYDLFFRAWPPKVRVREILGRLHGVLRGDVRFVPEDRGTSFPSLRDRTLLVEYERIGGDYPLHLIVIPRFKQKTVPLHEAASRIAQVCRVEVVADDGTDNPARWLQFMPDGRIVPVRVDPHRAEALYVVSDDADFRAAD